jgi:hypothetical protein
VEEEEETVVVVGATTSEAISGIVYVKTNSDTLSVK